MYDEKIAAHYAAFRPPLHEIILHRALGEFDKKPLGLDIGCGTGRSAQALKRYCHSVVGIEPSLAMISQAEPQADIKYINASAEDIPLADKQADIVTLAGSLHCIDREVLVGELQRVCYPQALILVYDFKIDLCGIKQSLHLQETQKASAYDHSINLHGFARLTENSVFDDEISLELTAIQAAHLLLASGSNYQTLAHKYQLPDLFDALVQDIQSKTADLLKVRANIYYSMYTLE